MLQSRSTARMHARLLVPLAFCLAVTAACAPRRIPNTQIDDTEDTRAILGVMEKYRNAMESKDAGAIVALASPTFHDAGGTPNPDDDVAFQNLEQALVDRFAKVQNLNLVLDVRSINVDDERAEAIYYYTLRYDIPEFANVRQSASDLKKMQLERVEDEWRIVSGI